MVWISVADQGRNVIRGMETWEDNRFRELQESQHGGMCVQGWSSRLIGTSFESYLKYYGKNLKTENVEVYSFKKVQEETKLQEDTLQSNLTVVSKFLEF